MNTQQIQFNRQKVAALLFGDLIPVLAAGLAWAGPEANGSIFQPAQMAQDCAYSTQPGHPERAAPTYRAGNGPLHQPRYETLIAALQSQLDEAAFKLAWTRGAAMSLEQAIQYALEIPRWIDPLNYIPSNIPPNALQTLLMIN
jgi:hypothetical protein